MTEPGAYGNSKALFERAQRSLAGGVSSHFRLGGNPVTLSFVRAEGSKLWDADGNEYIDYALGMGPTILGHAAPAVTEAVAKSLATGQLYAGQNELEIDLAEAFQRLVPCAELVRFGLSGSEVIQAALRVARAATERQTIVKFEGMYHGWLDAAFVAGDTAHPIANGVYRPVPMSGGQPAPSQDDCLVVRWNDEEAIRAAFELGNGEIAGVIMEGISCNVGVIMPRPGFLECVRKLCDRAGALLILDEVITGFRVALGGAQQLLDVTPDLAVYAKAIGGGFPIAALVGRESAMAPLADGSVVHAGTYNSSVPTVAAAIATIGELERDCGRALTVIDERGRQLIDSLREAAARIGVDLHVQGVGAVFNTTFGVDGPTILSIEMYHQTRIDKQQRYLRMLLDRGVRPTSRGTWFVSAAHSESDIERTIEASCEALAQLASEAT